MGSPQNPTGQQITTLEKAGQLQMTGMPVKQRVKGGTLMILVSLPRQAVTLVKLDW